MCKKITPIMLSLICACSFCVVGCKPKMKEGDEKIDPTKTQLYVQNYNGGYGDEWLYSAKNRFEEMYKDVSYEDGKKGVQIMISSPKEVVTLASMTITTNEVFFQEKVAYSDYVSQDMFLDITDIVTEDLTEFGESRSIEDKLTDVQKNYLKTKDRYYAIPHYEGYSGINFDYDLFDSEGLWFSSNPDNGNNGFLRMGEEKSAGPDGVSGTYDDGLPVTYDDFFKLCDEMVLKGIIPISWSGFNPHYMNTLLTAIHMDYEGLEQGMLNYTFDGVAKNLIEVDEKTKEITKKPDTTITNATGYELYSQAGRYYALKFCEGIVGNDSYYSSDSFNLTQTHMLAQEDFLRGRFSSSKPRIGMLIDGIWWFNEAKGAFNDMVDTYGERASQENRKFGFMPFPKAPGAHSGLTLYDNAMSQSFINKKIPEYKIPLAKKFLQFCATDESLVEFSLMTNSPKALDYTISKEDKEKMNFYGKWVIDMGENSDVVYPVSSNPLLLDNQSRFTIHKQQWMTANNEAFPSQSLRIKPHTSYLTAEEYFKGMQDNYTKEKWDNLFGGKYF